MKIHSTHSITGDKASRALRYIAFCSAVVVSLGAVDANAQSLSVGSAE